MPPKQLFAAKRVCKRMKDQVEDPDLWKAMLQTNCPEVAPIVEDGQEEEFFKNFLDESFPPITEFKFVFALYHSGKMLWSVDWQGGELPPSKEIPEEIRSAGWTENDFDENLWTAKLFVAYKGNFKLFDLVPSEFEVG